MSGDQENIQEQLNMLKSKLDHLDIRLDLINDMIPKLTRTISGVRSFANMQMETHEDKIKKFDKQFYDLRLRLISEIESRINAELVDIMEHIAKEYKDEKRDSN